MKKTLYIALISIHAICYGQGIKGIYRLNHNIYAFSTDSFKVVYSYEAYRFHEDTVTYDTMFNAVQGTLQIRKGYLILGASAGHQKQKYKIILSADSGIHCLNKGKSSQPLFFRKLNMSQRQFDSLYKSHKSKRIYSAGWRRRNYFPKTKLVLYNTENKKTKTLVQKKTLHFIRFYTDTFAGRLDTFRQEIDGTIDSANDSFVYIRAFSYELSNQFLFPDKYVISKHKPNIRSEWYGIPDTVLVIPKQQLYRVTFYNHSGDHSGGFVSGSINTLFLPLYAINYDTYTVNKRVAINGLAVSACFFIIGTVDRWIVPSIKDYYLTPSPDSRGEWVILRVEK